MIFLAIRPLNDISISLSLIFRKVSLSADAHPETFQGRKGFVELEHYDKNFVKNTTKRRQQAKFWSLSAK